MKVGLRGGGGAPHGLHAAQRQPQRGGERDRLGHVLLQVYLAYYRPFSSDLRML